MQLLAFGRRQVLETQVLDLTAVVTGMDGCFGGNHPPTT